MSDVVTNMKVRFGADTKQFKKGMNDGKKAVQTFKNDAGSAMEAFANQFGVSLGPLSGVLNKATVATKGLSAGMKGAATSSNVFTAALKILKTALIATGIGAIVVALGTLITYFTKTQRGADKVSKVMAGFKAIIGVLIDRLSMFGEGLFKIFTGRFKEGWDALKESAKGVGDEMKNEAKIAYDLEAAQQALRDREIELIEVQAKRRKEIAAARLLAEDETVAAEKRMKALKAAQDLEKKTLAENKAIQQERIRIMEEEIALGESTAEDYRMLAEAKASLQDIEAQSLKMQKRLQTEINTLTNEIEAETAAIVKQREELAKDFKEITPEGVDLGVTATLNTDGLETDKLTQWASNLSSALEPAKTVIMDFADAFNSTFEGLAVSFGESIGDLISGAGGFKDFGKIVLAALGDLAIQVGKIAIGAGIAVLGIKQALMSLNPFVAIAAGAALVALGSAVKGALSNAANSGGTYSGNSGVYDTRTTSDVSRNAYEQQAQKVQVEVVGKSEIENDHIRIAYEKAMVLNSQTT